MCMEYHDISIFLWGVSDLVIINFVTIGMKPYIFCLL